MISIEERYYNPRGSGFNRERFNCHMDESEWKMDSSPLLAQAGEDRQ